MNRLGGTEKKSERGDLKVDRLTPLGRGTCAWLWRDARGTLRAMKEPVQPPRRAGRRPASGARTNDPQRTMDSPVEVARSGA